MLIGLSRTQSLTQQQIQLSSVALFLREANSFVASSYDAIARSAPHIYLSALSFAAKDSLIWQYFGSRCTGVVSVENFGIDRHGHRLVMTLTGLNALANSIAYSQNGRYLASSCVSGPQFYFMPYHETLRVWDTRTGEEVMIPMVVDYYEKILAITFVSDDMAVALCTSKGLVRFWDISTGRDIRSWQCDESTGRIEFAAFSPDGTLVVTSFWPTGWLRETVSVWSTTTGKLISALQSRSLLAGIAISSNGRVAAISTGTLTIQIWDGHTGLSIGDPVVFEDYMGSIEESSLAMSPDGTVLAVGLYRAGSIEVYDLSTQTRATLSVHSLFSASSLAFSPDGLHLAVACDKKISLYDWRTKQESATPLHGHTDDISLIAYSPNGVHIASASEDLTIRIWDVGSNTAVPQPLPHPSGIACMALSSNNDIVVSGSHGRSVQVWDARNGQQKLEIQLGIESRVSYVAISPDGRLIASASHPCPPDSMIRLWNAQTGDPVQNMLDCSEGVIREMAFLPDMSQLVSMTMLEAPHDTTCTAVNMWNLATGLPSTLGTFEAETDFGLEPSSILMSVSPDGQHLAVAVVWTEQVHIWQTSSGRSLGAPFQCPFDVSSVAFSRDGSKIVTGTLSGTFEVRNIHSRQIVSVHADDIPRREASYGSKFGNKFNWLARSLDERFMAREAGKIGRKMRLWDAEMPGVVTTVELNHVHAGAAFSTDSQSLVIGGYGKIMVWQVEEVLALASGPRCNPLSQLLREGVRWDGWVVGSSGELLLWIPAAYRGYVQLPPCTNMISKHRVVLSADATGLHYGTDWTSCWR